MYSRLHVVFCVFLSFYFSNGYKILVVFPVPGWSMNILGHAIVRNLLSAGHEVTYVTVYPLENVTASQNLRQINIIENTKLFKEKDAYHIGRYMEEGISSYRYKFVQEMGQAIAKTTFNNSHVKILLKNVEDKFDVVIADLFETEIYSGLSALYGCPMIWSYSMGAHWFALRLIDESSNPAYSIDYFSYNYPPLSFFQRFQELLSRVQWLFIKWWFISPKEKKMYEKTFKPLFEERGQILPHYEDLIYNSSLIISNDYINPATPKVPQNLKLVGGYHIPNSVESLPTELENIFSNSKDGIIYFSMGSTWQSKDFPRENIKKILHMFRELKQTVLWKFEDKLEDVPANVHVVKWAPQHSVLAHPNCKIFITHGGQMSTLEAIYFGIPVIGVPINFDQFTNVQRAVKMGYALKVDLNLALDKNLKIALNEIIEDQKYRRRAKEISAIFHDRPVPPGKELVHWVEHVIKTRGALHLRSPALALAWYQKIYLDLIILITVILFAVSVFIHILCKRNKSTKDRSKTNEKKLN